MDGIAFPVSFGYWLKLRRKALGLTQNELATRASCSLFSMWKFELGERRPSKQLAALLAHVLEIPPQDRSTFVKVARGEGITKQLIPPSLTSSSLTTPVRDPRPLP